MEDLAELFLQVPLALAKGETAEKAARAYLAKSSELSRLYEANIERWPNADFYSLAVKNNMEGFELLGDRLAKII